MVGPSCDGFLNPLPALLVNITEQAIEDFGDKGHWRQTEISYAGNPLPCNREESTKLFYTQIFN